MESESRDVLHVHPSYQRVFDGFGLDAASVFARPDIKPWRSLSDRENCTLDLVRADGSTSRFHVKRYAAASRAGLLPAEEEERGYRALVERMIPTADLAAWGTLADRRSFTIFADLVGHHPVDKLIAAGASFDRLLEPIADLAAKLHSSGLHHRDLYLCHFFAKPDGAPDVRLIDTARVRALGCRLTRRRWIVKDLAQFWYSTLSLPIHDAQRTAWLDRYAERAGATSAERLRKSIARKVRWIARHDEKLRQREPNRNISIASRA